MTQRFGALAAEIIIDSTNNKIVFTENGGADLTATIAVGTYFLTDETNGDSLLAALVSALDAASGLHTFSTYLQVEPAASTVAATLGQWAYLYIFGTPDPTAVSNIVFKWSDVLTTFDPAQIGGDTNGVDYTWADEGTYTRFVSTHCPVSLFVPDAVLTDDDDPVAATDIVNHKGPTNSRSSYVVADKEERKTISWQYIEHDRVHRKATGLAFAAEEWGCFATLWAQETFKGGRLQFFAWDVPGVASALAAADFEGTFVFVELPSDLPVTRASRAVALYDVGPLLLAPYVS